MANVHFIKISLTAEERYKLKQARLKLEKISQLTAIELHNITTINMSRCQLLVALSQFQCLGSVGPKMAIKLYNLDQLKRGNPIAMVKNYEQ